MYFEIEKDNIIIFILSKYNNLVFLYNNIFFLNNNIIKLNDYIIAGIKF